MAALVQLIVFPIMLLNIFGGIAGAVWLLFLGDWRLALVGVVVSVIASNILFLPLGLGVLFSGGAIASLNSRHYVIGFILGLLGATWTFTIITAWCVLVFTTVLAAQQVDEPRLPFLLLAYATATGPWTYMASFDRQGEGGSTTIATLATCIGCALLIVVGLLRPDPDFRTMLVPFLIPVVAGLLLQASLIASIALAHRSADRA